MAEKKRSILPELLLGAGGATGAAASLAALKKLHQQTTGKLEALSALLNKVRQAYQQAEQKFTPRALYTASQKRFLKTINQLRHARGPQALQSFWWQARQKGISEKDWLKLFEEMWKRGKYHEESKFLKDLLRAGFKGRALVNLRKREAEIFLNALKNLRRAQLGLGASTAVLIGAIPTKKKKSTIAKWIAAGGAGALAALLAGKLRGRWPAVIQ